MRILIIENKQRSITHLETLLKEIAPAKKVVGRCTSIKEATQWLQNNPMPNLIFSVVQLPDGLSFPIFKKLKSKPPVVFTCAYTKYAMDAFKANGIHYLLKPVKKEELREALKRYEANFSQEQNRKDSKEHAVPDDTHYQERFIVTVGNQMKLIKSEEVAYFYTENKIVYMVTFDGTKYIMDHMLERLEEILNPRLFFRINRQFIINLSSIVKMTPASKSRLQLTLKPEINYDAVTSFGRTGDFRKWLLGGV